MRIKIAILRIIKNTIILIKLISALYFNVIYECRMKQIAAIKLLSFFNEAIEQMKQQAM